MPLASYPMQNVISNLQINAFQPIIIARMRTPPILPGSCYTAKLLSVVEFAAICAWFLQDLKEGMFLDALIAKALPLGGQNRIIAAQVHSKFPVQINPH